MSGGRGLRSRVFAAATLRQLVGSPARADTQRRVVLLDRPAASDLDTEVVARIRGELTAAGFEVMVLPVSPELEARVAVETAADELKPVLVVVLAQSIDVESGEHVLEVWLSDRVLRRTLVQRLHIDPAQASGGASRLAVQVVELLRARHAELFIRSQEAPAAAPPAVQKAEVVEAAPATRATLALGGGFLNDFQELGGVWVPLLRVGALLPHVGGRLLQLEARASLSTFAQETHLLAAPGAVRVQQQFGMAEAVVHLGVNLRVQPVLSVGMGVYNVDLSGDAPVGYRSSSRRTWSMLTAAGGGVWVRPVPWLACAAEAQLLTAWSKTVVRVLGDEVARAGEPMLLLSGALVYLF
ncbi:MAG TPA: hypothetical protein VER33_07055 [Polyangiaceae bacterium]|nr:hypothetical protein [Polyangiaceae bacterium]